MIKNLNYLTDFKLIKSNSLPIFGALLILTTSYAFGQYKIDPKFEHIIKKRKNNISQKTNSTLINNEVLPITKLISPDGTVKDYYQAIIYTENPEQLKKDGYIVQSVSKNFVTALLLEEDLKGLKDYPYISSVEFPKINYINNQSNVIESGANLLHNGILNETNYTGKDILVGIYDTGIDFTHPDFIDPVTKKTRILSIWDQSITPIAGENSPNLYPTVNTGVEYTQDHINNEIDGTPANYIREKDINGHGTHVAGSAAGNGSALEGNPYKGMAPESTLVIVKGGNGGFSSTNTIAALDYFKKISEEQGKPIVVNMSLGGQASAHDGNTAEEVKVNEFTASGPGRITVIAAGNDGSGNIHQRISLVPSEKKSFKIEIGKKLTEYPSVLFGFLVFANEKGSSDITAKLTTPNGDIFIQDVGTDSLYPRYDEAGDIYQLIDMNNYIDNESFKRFINIQIDKYTNEHTEGIFDIEITNNSEKEITLDGWLYLKNHFLADVNLSDSDNNYTIASPGSADEAITVANHISKLAFISEGQTHITPDETLQGEINHTSSKGPRADEARKPDIASAGTFIISTKSKDYRNATVIDGKYYTPLTGTSMSSPTVAGGVALLLQANKQLTAKDVKQRLIENVNQDKFTTNTYTNEFGYGKLNIYKAVSNEINRLNNNTACPISLNYFANSDIVSHKLSDLSSFNYGTRHIGTKLTSPATGKIGNITYYLGIYNNISASRTPLTIQIRKVNNEGTPGDLIATKTIQNISTLEQLGWNNLSFEDENINVVAGEEFFVILNTNNGDELILVSDSTNANGKTYVSTDGTTFTPNHQTNAKIRAAIYEDLPAVKQLATSSKTATQVVDLGYNHFVNGCELITRVEANGAAPISGNTTANVWIDNNVDGFVQRRVEVNTNDNNSTSTGKVTLFYSQADFDAYNQNATIKLPTSPTDEANKANIVVHFYNGKSADNTGTPASYNTTPVNTKVDASEVVWNNTYKYWEITVDAVGFGGYLLSSNTTLSNIDNTLSLLTVYPNPVVNELSINLPSNIKEAQINIVDVTGRTVITNKVTKSSDKINVSNLAKGVYIVEIKTTNGTVTKKIIKK